MRQRMTKMRTYCFCLLSRRLRHIWDTTRERPGHKKTPKAQRTQKGDRRKIDEDTKKGNKCKNKSKTIGDDVNWIVARISRWWWWWSCWWWWWRWSQCKLGQTNKHIGWGRLAFVYSPCFCLHNMMKTGMKMIKMIKMTNRIKIMMVKMKMAVGDESA